MFFFRILVEKNIAPPPPANLNVRVVKLRLNKVTEVGFWFALKFIWKLWFPWELAGGMNSFNDFNAFNWSISLFVPTDTGKLTQKQIKKRKRIRYLRLKMSFKDA